MEFVCHCEDIESLCEGFVCHCEDIEPLCGDFVCHCGGFVFLWRFLVNL